MHSFSGDSIGWGDIRILHVDDDPDVVTLTAGFLERKHERFTVTTETDPTTAIDRIAETDFDCIVSDYQMPDVDGLELLEYVRHDLDSDVPFVLFTGKGREDVAMEALNLGADRYLQKGSDPEVQYSVLASAIAQAVDHHRSTNERLRAERRYRSLFENNPLVIWEVDFSACKQYLDDLVIEADDLETYLAAHPAERRTLREKMAVVDVNERALAYYGAESKADVVDHRDRLLTERVEQADGSMWANVADGETHFRMRNTSRTLDDERKHEIVDVYVPAEFADEYARAYVTVTDVTECEQKKRELERYRTLVETVGDPMYILDTDGVVQTANAAMVDHLGYPREEIVGSHATKFMAEADFRTGTELLRELLDDDDSEWVRFELRVTDADGNERLHENNMAVLTNDGAFAGTVGVVRDITEHKERTRELERTNRRLKQFVSTVSHDLRNPLTVALAYTDHALETGDLDGLHKTAESLSRMEAMIEDLLHLARAGSTIDETETTSLRVLAEDAWETVQTGHAILDVAVNTDVTIDCDRDRIVEVFENLFRNAVEHGGSDVTIRVDTLADRPGFVVEDDGSGIPDAERERVFEKGYSTSDDGTGFGLNIVREIVEAHGWDVAIEDGASGGARFEIVGVDVDDR
ncbi:MAG: PAS domain S-box protein [Haloarculaceae archaeon]